MDACLLAPLVGPLVVRARVRAIPLAALVGLAAIAPLVDAAASTPAPGVPERIDATYAVAFTSLTGVRLDVRLAAHQVLSRGDSLSADEVRDQYQGITRFASRAKGDEFLAEIEGDLAASFAATLAKAFPDATSRSVTRAQIVRSSLDAKSDVRPYDPPVEIALGALVEKDRGSLGLGDLSEEAVDAAFAAGARYYTNVTLVADSGYAVDYEITAPPGLAWGDVEGGVLRDAATVVASVDNAAGRTDRSARLGVSLRDPDASEPSAEDVQSAVRLRIPKFELTGSSLPIEALIRSEVRAMSVAERFPDVLPASVKLSFLGADALRALRETGAVGDEELEDARAKLLDAVRQSLSASLGAGVAVSGQFEPGSIDGGARADPFGTEPPLVFEADARGVHEIANLPADVQGKRLDGFFEAGASIEVNVTLSSEAGRRTEFTLEIPPSVEFESATEGGALSSDRHSVAWTLDATALAEKLERVVSVRVHDAEAARPTKQDASLNVVVDLRDIDVQISKAIGGDFGDLVVDVRASARLDAIELPQEVKEKLPASARLDFLTADAIRILHRDGLISKQDLQDVEKRLLDEAQKNIGNALGTNEKVQGGFVWDTLDKSRIGATAAVAGGALGAAAGNPIEVTFSLSARRPISGASAPQAQAATSLYTAPAITFDLPRVQGLDTTYKVVLPKGITLVSRAAEQGEISSGEEDGREYMLVRPTGDAPAHTTFSVGVTPSFVVTKFWPVLLLAGLVLLLVVAGPIAAIVLVRRRRRHRAAAAVPKP